MGFSLTVHLNYSMIPRLNQITNKKDSKGSFTFFFGRMVVISFASRKLYMAFVKAKPVKYNSVFGPLKPKSIVLFFSNN